MGSLKDDPHNHRSSSGHSLEIFLFSNGQQDSPPRKYNVRVNDSCNNTLNFLAKSQNGSDHTIELYTTLGKRIGKTQELANGTAYVAVEPPQAFIPSGYNDYLMKASRSREKRQEKLPENNKFINPDKKYSKVKTQEEIKDGTNIKIIQDITIRPTSRTTVEEQDTTTGKDKSEIANAKTAKPIGRMSTKQMQKKNNPLPQPNFHTLKKNTNNVTPPVKRKNVISKIDTTKKKVDISSLQRTKTNPINKTIESKAKSEVAGIIQIISDIQDHTEAVGAYDLLKHTDTSVMPDRNVMSYKETQILKLDSTFTEKHLLLPVSQEKDLPESECIIPINAASKSDLLSNERESILAPHQDVRHVPEKLSGSPLSEGPLAKFPTEIDRTEINKNELNNMSNEILKKNVLIFGSQTGDSNFTIYVKPSDVGNLKLNIEVKNVSESMLETKNIHDVKSTTSVVNTLKTDYGIPSKGRTQTKGYREAPTLTEPWLAGLPYVQLQQTDNEQGAVGRCHCCSCPRMEGEGVAPVYVDNNNYFILLPPEELKEQLLSCACKLETNQEVNHEMSNNHETPRIRNHIVKLDGKKHLIPNHLTDPTDMNKNSAINKNIQDHILDKNQSLSDNGMTDEDMSQCDCCDCSVQYQTPTSDLAQNLIPELPVCDHEQANRPDFVIKEHTQVNKDPTMLKEAFTQTDWSGIVLEVRPREDGSYEFHIPSLKVLKMTNSLY